MKIQGYIGNNNLTIVQFQIFIFRQFKILIFRDGLVQSLCSQNSLSGTPYKQVILFLFINIYIIYILHICLKGMHLLHTCK